MALTDTFVKQPDTVSVFWFVIDNFPSCAKGS